jgi:tripeptide aminopeptidase
MFDNLNEIVKALPRFHNELLELNEILLANLIMIGEIPAPTFEEEHRIDFLKNRFTESGLLSTSSDETGNALGVLYGEKGERNIIVVAHADTVFPATADHTLSIQMDRVTGPAVGDNSLGCAVLATLPKILDVLNIPIYSNIIFMGSSRSLGRGNLEGLRFFLSNFKDPIVAGLCIEGVELGRLSYTSLGMLRGEITCRMPESYDWTRFGAVGAIVTLNEVINKILEIPLPRRPRTTVVLGSIHGGASFNTIATNASLRFEVRSEAEGMVKNIALEIEDIVATVASHTGAEIKLERIAERRPGGIPFNHFLARAARSILNGLNIKPRISPSTSELSAFIDRKIPALTVGITNGEHLNEPNETIKIEPISIGITQLLGLLLVIDRGLYIEHQ